jgi:3-phenylpropionate/trans-cinnamate dioxygenase ferredoxin component
MTAGDPNPTTADFEAVASLADIPSTGLLSVTTSTGERICLVRRENTLTAVSDVCTHQEFSMSLGDLRPDGTLQCAWHGAEFDCLTGAACEGPATDPLPVYAVRVEGDRVSVGRMMDRKGRGFRPAPVTLSV